MSLMVVGSVALDTIETPSTRKEKLLGGSATYFSLASSFFTEVNMVGVVGEDFPNEHIELLKKHKVDLRGLQKVKGKTFHWEGRYGENLNERITIKTELNVFGDFRPEIPDSYKEAEYIFLANIDPDLQIHTLRQVKKTKVVASDTISLWISTKKERLKELLKEVNIFIINDVEVREFSKEYDIIKGASYIQSIGPEIVIVKRGEYGSITFNKDKIFVLPGFPVSKFVDPTGAGDSFAGGFMGYLAKSDDLSDNNIRQAVVWGSVMGSFCVEDFSVDRFRTLNFKEIKERFNKYREYTQF